MNLLLVGENEKVVDEDAINFYHLLSTCIQQALNPESDSITVTKADRASRSAAAHILLCNINGERYVALKRCSDNHEFMRREMAIAAAKRRLGLPSYNVLQINGIQMRSSRNNSSCKLFDGWEHRTMLVIDFGNYKYSKNFHELSTTEITNLRQFCYNYGVWAAFNYALTVRDRHGGNFIFFTDTQFLHSVDNEEGPFDSNGIDGGVMDIVIQTRNNIDKFLIGQERHQFVQQLRKGFKDGLNRLNKQYYELDMFLPKEFALIRQRIDNAPPNLDVAIFPS